MRPVLFCLLVVLCLGCVGTHEETGVITNVQELSGYGRLITFKDGTTWKVLDERGVPWHTGRPVKVTCRVWRGRATVESVTDCDSSEAVNELTTEPIKLAKSPPETPENNPQKVLFSGSTRLGDITITETEQGVIITSAKEGTSK